MRQSLKTIYILALTTLKGSWAALGCLSRFTPHDGFAPGPRTKRKWHSNKNPKQNQPNISNHLNNMLLEMLGSKETDRCH